MKTIYLALQDLDISVLSYFERYEIIFYLMNFPENARVGEDFVASLETRLKLSLFVCLFFLRSNSYEIKDGNNGHHKHEAWHHTRLRRRRKILACAACSSDLLACRCGLLWLLYWRTTTFGWVFRTLSQEQIRSYYGHEGPRLNWFAGALSGRACLPEPCEAVKR
jgi:hypothetical protein